MRLRDQPVYDRTAVEQKILRRERSEQFLSLPPDAQEEYRRRWRRELAVQIDREDRIHGMREESMLVGAAFFLVAFLAMVPFRWPGLLVFPMGGALFGWLLHLTRAGRFRALVIGTPVYLLTCGVAAACGVHGGGGFDALVVFFSCPVVGLMREFRGGEGNPAGLLRRRARRWAGDTDAPHGALGGGAAETLPSRAHTCVGAGWSAPEQGGDERRPPSWTEWDFGAGDEEP